MRSEASGQGEGTRHRTRGSETKGKPTRSRTFTGCVACRDRHLKCDELKPKCSLCCRLDLPCQGSAPRLFWANPKCRGDDDSLAPDHRTKQSSYRFPLYRDDVRKRLCADLVQSLGKESVDQLLIGLDSESIAGGDADLRSAGPFGVFRAVASVRDLNQAVSTDNPDRAEEDNISPPGPEAFQVTAANANENEIQTQDYADNNSIDELSAWQTWPGGLQDLRFLPEGPAIDLQDDMDADLVNGCSDENLQDMIQSATQSFDQDVDMLTFDAGSPFSIRDADVGAFAANNTQPRTDTKESNTTLQSDETEDPIEDSSLDFLSIPPQVSLTLSPTKGSIIPLHSDKLLRYLKDIVLGGTSSSLFPSRISPWNDLLLPCGLETYAELSLWNRSSHTRLSILCSLLAKGAWNLHRSNMREQSLRDHWYQIAVKHCYDAQTHLKKALATEFEGPKQVKYTELLMAMLGLGSVLIYFKGFGSMKKVLVDTESLIRLRGLHSERSHQHRILHHMYTHLRVIMESISIPAIEAPEGVGSPNLLSSDPSTAIAKRETRFRMSEASLCKLDYDSEKAADIGYNDIHLEIPGKWDMTLYPDMYGFSEALMTLHSQTISFVNERLKLEKRAAEDPIMATALQMHIKMLENQIWSWSNQTMGPERPKSLVTPNAAEQQRQSITQLSTAIQQALIIYFYRRVYNFSAMMFQSSVLTTLESIEPYIQLWNYDLDFGLTLSWALFVAACEAITPEVQARYLPLLEIVDECGTFMGMSKPSTIAKNVWEERTRSNDFTFSWPNVMCWEI